MSEPSTSDGLADALRRLSVRELSVVAEALAVAISVDAGLPTRGPGWSVVERRCAGRLWHEVVDVRAELLRTDVEAPR